MAITAKLDRGSNGTINLQDDTNYNVLQGWQPKVGTRRGSTLGGRGVFNDVDEFVPIRVYSKTSAADAYSALVDLSEAMEQAASWARGGPDDPVIFEYGAEGSGLGSALEAVVWGAHERAPELLSLPVRFNELMNVWEINPVTLPIRRMGVWLDAEVSEDSASAAAQVPNEITATFANSVAIPSPTKVTITLDSVCLLDSAAFVLLSGDDDPFNFISAEDLGGTNFSTVADTTNKARNGSVKRFTPPDTNSYSAALDFGLSTYDADLIFIFGAVRNNSGSAEWAVSITMYDRRLVELPTTRPVVIGNDTTDPQLVYFGSVASIPDFRKIQLNVQVDDTTGSPTLDFDYFVLMKVSENARAISYLGDSVRNFQLDSVILDPRALTKPTPRIYIDNSGAGASEWELPYLGDLYFESIGDTIHCVFLATRSNYWVLVDTSNANVNASLTADRRPAYLVPS